MSKDNNRGSCYRPSSPPQSIQCNSAFRRLKRLRPCLNIMAATAAAWFGVEAACGWSGEHNRITSAAIEGLPPNDRAIIAPEAPALARVYCEFPDLNWPCYGEWGGGNADPRLPRFPDTRREWDISFYCGWDPVLRKGKSYPHRPPESFDAVALYFAKTLDALQAGRLADGARFAGVMLHYIQDSGSFPHIQPLHRVFHTKNLDAIRIDDHTPHQLGQTPTEATAALTARVRRLVNWTEQRLAPLLAQTGASLDEAKRLCKRDLLPATVARAVAKLRAEKPADYESAVLDCANECARVCADALHSALALTPRPQAAPVPNPPDINLVFNPSFETGDGDQAPEGWCVGWLDLSDRAGRAEWYRAGTHWNKPVKSGQRSVLILYAPRKGLEWRQTWRRALQVKTGETYRGTVWVKTRAATGATWFALQFFDTAYQPIGITKSEVVKVDNEWRKLSVEARVPPDARWLRAILHTEANNGAAWFDDVEIMRISH